MCGAVWRTFPRAVRCGFQILLANPIVWVGAVIDPMAARFGVRVRLSEGIKKSATVRFGAFFRDGVNPAVGLGHIYNKN